MDRSCFQQPLPKPCMRFSLTRLSIGHSPRCALVERLHADSPFVGVCRLSPITSRLSCCRIVRLQGLPSKQVVLSCLSYRYYAPLRLPLGCASALPRRASPVPWSDCLRVPLPIHRRVRCGCDSKVFPTSMAFTAKCSARLPLAPFQGIVTMRQDSLDAADRALACPT